MSSDSSMLRERGEDSPRTPAQLREAVGKGAEDLPPPLPDLAFTLPAEGPGPSPPEQGQLVGLAGPACHQGKALTGSQK